jgi:uncharacterized delta-60 repeat protein
MKSNVLEPIVCAGIPEPPSCGSAQRAFCAMAIACAVFTAPTCAHAAPGDVDLSFAPPAIESRGGEHAWASIHTTLAQPDGRVLIGGHFRFVENEERPNLARLHADGRLDEDFSPRIDGFVECMVLQPDGKLLVAGSFSAVNGVARNSIARLHSDGSLDQSFQAEVQRVRAFDTIHGWVRTMVLQLDGSVLVGGGFDLVNGLWRESIARLHPDGSLDWGFSPLLQRIHPELGVHVLNIALQSDAKVLVTGSFDAGSGVRGFARFNPDGTLDNTFVPDPTLTWVRRLALQPDGRILVGGSVEGRIQMRRLAPNGALEGSAFVDPATSSAGGWMVQPIVVQPDGKVLLAGDFASINSLARKRVVRFHRDGSVDMGFNPSFAGAPSLVEGCMALQPDGKVLLGGTWGNSDGIARAFLVRLHGGEPPPRLKVGRSGAEVVLSWPAAGAAGFFLETTDDLNGTANWRRETAQATLAGDEFRFEMESQGSARFFRLQRE